MKLYLSAPENKTLNSAIKITGSKSESNRLLLLQALYPNIKIENLSNSDDAIVMQKGIKVSKGEVDIHHAGTAMRFLTTYFSCQDGKEVVLTGSKRMTERPIGVLVDALKSLGADITYLENSGYPPLHIKGKKITTNKVSLPANISSQYISSLVLTAPSLDNGLELELVGKITSVPYIKMTLALLTQIGVENSFEGNTIKVAPKKSVSNTTLVVESDWSSASYFYSIVAMSAVGTEITLSAYKKDSLQGDSVLADIYTDFGVETTFLDAKVVLKKITDKETQEITKDLSNAPDIAQTIAVTVFGLGLGCHLTGLHTLKIKETDRLEALKTELTKLGASITVTDKTLTIKPTTKINKDIAIDTYNDHRMGMAFAPLALKTNLFINDAGVVSKSYPDFWTDLKLLKFGVKEA
ncbi:3-phosphoshikimate 1-carboxyvinyltransferase [Cellulophaga lytica]|uniref:3-phosphoshikimate 1-carboxyvinyltransferase n=1 Tax=Cellulophaga lytica (strain ATCC 23178 / DSM 7489 / JCM 8516 / NBRC 14961 / NCIMB 1423 / VKM B-1433 / Cy l20) TaxID=867900 RepID=F0RDQ4_CELLC|nr:3-phosphoshikimate 1-carboxyvinyltransferase [Cellulophaga lytica]ADY29815.1 3-phosphoshikimate 1-carboxyvinyltransferase [Cellulophaga lytica DSM 7489]AIM60814.1 3-phosphoshikimate 1-carboxyvinyltransferase [Cellulophaga lytica]WQG76019.1 3-phosphoshikimate 1-carboxyvinyltransferase [Cellulophaga lytica]